ncbi:phenylacetate--CoA ligase family protein [Flavobacterium sp. JP2137]|uniref:phenylacetate--CoA ligase family protein n=1 Tax=Flavobacterium sp. JP2137 TaxID=3414510 RepID=UPI003D2FD92F
MKERIYRLLPRFLQEFTISVFNVRAYKDRYGGRYNEFLKRAIENRTLTLDELKANQKDRYSAFINQVIENSDYYKDLYQGASKPELLQNITNLPLLTKEQLRENIKSIVIKTDKKLISSKTGGTTGKSLEVFYTKENSQERFAILDEFRSRFGYKLGEKTAWFSGKSILTTKDIKENVFWKTDHKYNVRYYSTFHIKEGYLKHYVENLLTFKPKYFVGFPSTILEIAKYGISNGYHYPENSILAIFPTAETITDEMRIIIETFFKTKIYNQYASSEGAPFIFECVNGNLHLELQSGVFEVLDDNNHYSQSGRLVVTSFTTEATPLIRYDIGDSISLEDENKTCLCGNNNPLVKEILGRIDDYIYSPENGKINLGNISNTLKEINGIIRFQAIQNDLDSIDLLIVVDDAVYSKKTELKFINNWRDRIGNKMNLNLLYVDEIPVEKSGKYRFVKNNIKHLINFPI